MGNAIQLVSTKTTVITDIRRAVFIELRERGAETCVAKSSLDLQRLRQRRHSNYASVFGTFQANNINVVEDINKGDFVEVYIPPKSLILSVKKCKLMNISTPFVLISGHSADPHAEIFLSTPNYSVISNLERRQCFASDIYNLAQQSNDPMYKIAALRSMEQYFVAMIAMGKVDRALGEKKYALFDKVQERIWRGSTPGEQVAAFLRAWAILANITGLSAANNDAEIAR